jgi:hypothetical protein
VSVVPIEEEINKTRKQIDDLEWEGVYCEHLKRYLDDLIKIQLEGEVWYPLF